MYTLECKLQIFTNEIIFVILVSIQLNAFQIEGLARNLTQLNAAQIGATLALMCFA